MRLTKVGNENLMNMKFAVVTGASGGLGRSLVEMLAQNEWTVFALDVIPYKSSNIIEESIIPIVCDVANSESIQAAFQEVSKRTKKLDAVVNFAGILEMGSVIELPVDTMKKMLDINFLGMYQVNQVFFQLIVEGKGRIVNVSSETGVLSPAPFSAFYYLTKHAVEVYSNALRRELSFLDIPVITIRPGAFKSNMHGKATQIIENAIHNSTLFKENLKKGLKMAEQGAKNAKDAMILAKVIYKALNVKKPKIIYRVNTNILLKTLSILPEKNQDRIYKSVLK